MTHHSDLAFRSSQEISGRHRTRRVVAGEGFLTPVKDFTWQGDKWIAGRDRVVPDHEVVRDHPELFTPCYHKESDPAILKFLQRKRALSAAREPWRLSSIGGHKRPKTDT